MHGFACRNSVHLMSNRRLLLALTSFGVFAMFCVLAIAAPPRSRPGLPMSPIWVRLGGPGERLLDAADSRNGRSAVSPTSTRTAAALAADARGAVRLR